MIQYSLVGGYYILLVRGVVENRKQNMTKPKSGEKTMVISSLSLTTVVFLLVDY
jgi:hypothetical protein